MNTYTTKQQATVLRLVRSGVPAATVARAEGISVKTAQLWARRAGCSRPRGGSGRHFNASVRERATHLVGSGLSHVEASRVIGCSPDSVRLWCLAVRGAQTCSNSQAQRRRQIRAGLLGRARRAVDLRLVLTPHGARTSWASVGAALGIHARTASDLARAHAHRFGYDWQELRLRRPSVPLTSRLAA